MPGKVARRSNNLINCISVEKQTLQKWVVLLGQSGNNTKKTVKEEIEKLLENVGE
jgi:hypothetical protein